MISRLLFPFTDPLRFTFVPLRSVRCLDYLTTWWSTPLFYWFVHVCSLRSPFAFLFVLHRLHLSIFYVCSHRWFRVYSYVAFTFVDFDSWFPDFRFWFHVCWSILLPPPHILGDVDIRVFRYYYRVSVSHRCVWRYLVPTTIFWPYDHHFPPPPVYTKKIYRFTRRLLNLHAPFHTVALRILRPLFTHLTVLSIKLRRVTIFCIHRHL